MKEESDIFITLPLYDFVSVLLRDNESFHVSHKLGLVLDALSKDKCLVHVQWISFEGKNLQLPLVWRYKQWTESSTKYIIAKKKSDEERIAKFIFDANIKKVSRALMRSPYAMDESFAVSTAFSLLKNNRIGVIKHMLNVEVITKESEL